MKISHKSLAITVVGFLLVLFFLGARMFWGGEKDSRDSSVLTMGMTGGETGHFAAQLQATGRFMGYLELGRYHLDRGEIEEAISMFKTASEHTYSHPTRGLVCVSLADAHEKKKDYAKALEYVVLDRDKYVNDWAREPVAERARYLEYALEGNYEKAVEHAKRSIEARNKISNIRVSPERRDVRRLNDLKAAREYIESLGD